MYIKELIGSVMGLGTPLRVDHLMVVGSSWGHACSLMRHAYELQGMPILPTQLDCVPLAVHFNFISVVIAFYRFDSGS